MAKAILLMDMPDHGCFDCEFYMSDCHYETVSGCEHFNEGFRCLLTGHKGNQNTRPADCPLIPAIGYIEAKGNMISWEDDGDVD